MAAPEGSDLRTIIDAYEGRLTKADRSVIDVLLSDPAAGSYLSTNDVARRAEVHPTTAVRFARKLGFKSYPELRARLRQQFIEPNSEAANRILSRLDHMDDGSIMSGLIESEVRALRATPKHITQDQISQATAAIMAADQIYLFGRGHSTALVDLLCIRLNRSGYNAHGCNEIDWESPVIATKLKPKDVVLCFAFRRIRAETARLISLAQEAGAVTILISDLVGLTMRPRPNIVLAASRGGPGESQSLTVPMAICNTLILELSRQDRGRSVQSLKRVAEFRRRLADDNRF